MALAEILKRTCKKLGENNKPTYVVMAIATVKGICHPTFTMMDKTENPETKKYTALREGLTEVIAIPAYWACGELAGGLAKKAFKDKALAGRAEKNLMFMGVCIAALFVIPGLCSVAIKPIMDKIGLKAPDEKEKPSKKTITPTVNPYLTIPANQVIQRDKFPQVHTFTARPQIGMKVGGL